MTALSTNGLLVEFRAGKRLALSRAISLVENAGPGFDALLSELHASTGRAHRIGVTGPPGAGKSSLAAALVQRYRARGETVGIVAVDPSSPFTGGALLGDRIRMNELATDPGVFIRSMASRGSLGGLALATKEVADVLDAFGFDRVLLETVGVGQTELDVASAADTTIVVLTPESGDAVQAMKAGLMEISDVFVVNKSDRPGAERLAREIEQMLGLRAGRAYPGVPRAGAGAEAEAGAGRSPPTGAPQPQPKPQPRVAGQGGASDIPVIRTSAESGDGIDALIDALDHHRGWLQATGELTRRRRQRHAERVRQAVDRQIRERTWQDGREILEDALPALASGAETPYQVAARIVRALLG